MESETTWIFLCRSSTLSACKPILRRFGCPEALGSAWSVSEAPESFVATLTCKLRYRPHSPDEQENPTGFFANLIINQVGSLSRRRTISLSPFHSKSPVGDAG